jgi:TorA maturation chaperone TorD
VLAARAGVRVTSATVAGRMEGITAEPQAHAGILREIMASLASGQLPAPKESSRMVFEKHPAPWIGRFFADLERVELRNSTGST